MHPLVPSPRIRGSIRYAIEVSEPAWSSISVRLGTHFRRAAGHLVLSVRNRRGELLRTSAVDLAHVPDNSYVAFNFAPIAPARGFFLLVFELTDASGASLVSLYEGGGRRGLLRRVFDRLGVRYTRRGLSYALNDPTFGLTADAALPAMQEPYAAWTLRHALTPARVAELQRGIAELRSRPKISLLVPVWNPPQAALRRCIDSVLEQIYPHWELCLVDDASSAPHVREVLHRYGSDARIKLRFLERNGGIAAASNAALELASGDYVALLDHDDELSPDALAENALLIEAQPDVDFLYSDEDKIDEAGRRFYPSFKPGWSPELLHSTMYTGHLSVYRAELVRAVGGFRSELDGTQDYDLALRVAERARKILHIPKVLYHWRTVAASAAGGVDRKSGVFEVQRRALLATLARNGHGGDVHATAFPGNWRMLYPVDGQPLVSIVIPTAGRSRSVRGRTLDLLSHCIEAIEAKTAYPSYEIVAVHNGDLTPETLAFVSGRARVRLVEYKSRSFNLAEKMNLGVSAAHGEYVLLLNDDTEVKSPDWLASMLGIAQQGGVGAVGAKLLFEKGEYQHVGVVWIDDGPNHAFLGAPDGTPGPAVINHLRHDAVAVTGACLLVSKADYQRVGGFDADFPLNYNDVDFCLRLRREGLRVVFDPSAVLYHFESASKEGTAYKELELLLARWGKLTDPYYNPNYRQDRPFYEVDPGSGRRPPRDHQHWYLRRVVERRGAYPSSRQPLRFSLLTSAYDTPPRYLQELLRCVRHQSYRDFEWLIVDNGSRDTATAECLREIAALEPRARLVRVEQNQGIMGGMRLAFQHAAGDYVVPVDSDDLLSLDALQVLAHFIERCGRPPLVYSDEDKCDARSTQHSPFLKSDWDPVLFLCCCYVAHLCAIDRRAAAEAGAYQDDAATGCHDWDTFLRLLRRGARPLHVPEILYSWRIHSGSTASAETSAKPYTVTSQQHVLSRHLELLGRERHFEMRENHLYGHPGMWRLFRRRVDPKPLTLCIASENGPEELRACLDSVLETGYPGLRVVVLGDLDAARRARLEDRRGAFEGKGWTFEVQPGEVCARVRSAARAAQADGGFVTVLSDAVRLDDAGWAWEAAGLLEFHEDAVLVGGRIADDSERLVWAGGYFGFSGFLGSPDAGRSLADSGYHGAAFCQRSVQGIPALFWVGEPAFVGGALADAAPDASLARIASALALRAEQQGGRVVYSPFLSGRLQVAKAQVRPAEDTIPPGYADDRFLVTGRRYYHPLLSPNLGSAYRPLDVGRVFEVRASASARPGALLRA